MRVIVTGCDRGIGRATTQELLRRGHSYHGFSKSRGVDVREYDQVRSAFEALAEDPPDALVNNAGVVEIGNVVDLSPEDWHEQVNVNLNGMFYCSREYARILIAKGKPGKIVNITSNSGLAPREERSAYCASKAGAIMLSLTLSLELAPHDIKVYCVAPGACATDLRLKIRPDDDFEGIMTPEELAVVIADLIDDGNMLDGQVLEIKRR